MARSLPKVCPFLVTVFSMGGGARVGAWGVGLGWEHGGWG